MGSELSMAIVLKDSVSPAVNTIRGSLNAFDKDAEETARAIGNLQKKQEALRDAQALAKTKLDGLSAALQDAKKNYAGLEDELGTAKLKGLNKEYAIARDELRDYSAEIMRTRTEINALSDAKSRAANRAEGAPAPSGQTDSTGGGTLDKLWDSGLGKMLGDSVGNWISAQISSGYGAVQGKQINTVLSSTASGAAMGSAAGPWGTLIGGIAGFGAGFIDAATIGFKTEDDAFIALAQQNYNETKQKRQADLQAGVPLAAERETALISFESLFGDAGTALGMSRAEMAEAVKAIEQMKSTGKATLENLNPLADRGIRVFDYLAEAYGKTIDELYEGISEGKISGTDAAEIISQGAIESYGGGTKGQSLTYSGLESTLQGQEQDRQAALGEGYLSAREPFMEKQIKWNEEHAWRSEQDNALMGMYQASLENKQVQLQMDARDTLETGNVGELFVTPEAVERLREMHGEYIALHKEMADAEIQWRLSIGTENEEAAREKYSALGAQVGNLISEAEVIAKNEYIVTEGAQREVESQKALVSAIQTDTALNDAYYNTGVAFGQQLSLGLEHALQEVAELLMERQWRAEIERVENSTELEDVTWRSSGAYQAAKNYYDWLDGPDGAGPGFNNAAGLMYVPYDGYRAKLHEGERVLTASEARSYGNGGPAVQITGNSFTVREEADVGKIAAELARQLRLKQMVS